MTINEISRAMATGTAPLLLMLLMLLTINSASLRAEPREEIRAVISGLEESWNAGDMDGYLNAYARGNAMSLAFGNQSVTNWDDLNSLFRRSYPDPERMGRFTIDTFNVNLLTADVAVAYGRFTHYFPHEIVHGGYSHVLKKDAQGTWTIRHERTSRGSVEARE